MPIEGNFRSTSAYVSTPHYRRPDFCPECGEAYPWKAQTHAPVTAPTLAKEPAESTNQQKATMTIPSATHKVQDFFSFDKGLPPEKVIGVLEAVRRSWFEDIPLNYHFTADGDGYTDLNNDEVLAVAAKHRGQEDMLQAIAMKNGQQFQVAFQFKTAVGGTAGSMTIRLGDREVNERIRDFLREHLPLKPPMGTVTGGESQSDAEPPAIRESLAKFRADYPDPSRAAFIIMQFGKTKAHEDTVSAIRAELAKHGISGLRADDREYNDDLFGNILTYMHGCGFGIAVFERILADDFNPNVSLEVGYLLALGRPVCLLKDTTLKGLPTDIVGKLYRGFNPHDADATIAGELEKWLRDKEIIGAEVH